MFGCHAWQFCLLDLELSLRNMNSLDRNTLLDLTEINDFKIQRVLEGLLWNPPSSSIYIAKEDKDIAILTGILKSNREKSLYIEPKKNVMKEILKYIFKVSGQLYEDIPMVFRQSHVTLALYLKHCLRNRESIDNLPESRRHLYIQYDGLLKEKTENEVLKSICS